MVRIHFDMGASAVYFLFERDLVRHCFFRVCFVHPVCTIQDNISVVSLWAWIGVEGRSCCASVCINQACEGTDGQRDQVCGGCTERFRWEESRSATCVSHRDPGDGESAVGSVVHDIETGDGARQFETSLQT